MENQGVKRVVIAGGGTAGWIAAAALVTQLGPLLDITLIESEEIGTVGVGESTIPTARTFHRLIGLDEREFMRETESTFKLGILFEDWARIDDSYIHSFGMIGKSTWMADFHHIWMAAHEQGLASDLGDYCFELQAAKAGRFATSDDANINYAYHLDAGRYARYLRQFVEARGVRRVEGKIVEVQQNAQNGVIETLLLDSDVRIEGDLFIDCTGFRGLLIEQTLKAGYEDWSHWLPANAALPLQSASVGPALPYTRAMAHQAGWQWRIPLQHRVGNGLVYSSEFMSDDAAADLLHSRVEGDILVQPRPVRFQAGRRRSVWEKNCVALGLSSGFVEPLESTSIHLIMIGVTRLIQSFPFGGANEAVATHFNNQCRRELESIRDFVVLHYKLTERDDSEFWRYCRNMEVPDSLAQRIALFRESAMAYQSPDDLFRVDSWVQVMLGQRLKPRRYHQVGRLIPRDQLGDSLGHLKTNIVNAVSSLPSHHSFVEQYCRAS